MHRNYRKSFVVLLVAVALAGCAPQRASDLPPLSFAAAVDEINAGRGVAVEFQGTNAIATFAITPEEARNAGRDGTMFLVALPTNTVSKARFVSLCSEHGIEMRQYR